MNIKRLSKQRGALVLMLILAGCFACSTSEEYLASLIEAHDECQSDSDCTLVGGSDCHCPAVVNVTGHDKVLEAMADIPCCEPFRGCAMVECAAFSTIRCLEGKCHGD